MTAPPEVRQAHRLNSGSMSLFPQQFCDLVKEWLVDAEHPGIARVQTCAEIGRWEQPAGLKITLADGWAVVIQFVGSYGPNSPRGEPPTPESQIPLKDRDDYQAARAADERQAATVTRPARGAKPGMLAGEVLTMVEDLAKRADLPGVTEIRVGAPKLYTVSRQSLRVTFDDEATVTCYAVGMIPPGSTDFSHPAHEIPAGWF